MKSVKFKNAPSGLSSTLMILIQASSLLSVAAAAHADDETPYTGSSFNQVMSVIKDSDRGLSLRTPEERDEFAVYKNGGMPQYPVNFRSLGGLLASPLSVRSKKTLVDKTDYYDRLDKLVHANGICVSGRWNITENTPFTGLYSSHAAGLFVGRISVALQETTNAGNRGFGFAGKIFPTLDPNTVVPTTNFFTVDVLSGTPIQRFLDARLTNDPPLLPSIDLAGVLSKIVPAFAAADSSPTFRPVTQIAAAGAEGEVKSPVWMRLRPTDETAQATASVHEADFRTEVKKAMAANRGRLSFDIETSSTVSDRLASAGWQKVGTIDLDQEILSYGCDRRLTFAHPKDDQSKKNALKASAGGQ